MATVKLNTIGSTKSMEVWLRFGKACFACDKPQKFTEFQLEHIHPRELAETYPNGKANINESSNLCSLCKSCNSLKYLKSASEFYSAEKLAKLVKLQAVKLDSKLVLLAGDAYAKENPSGKFAKLHRGGLYWEANY